MPLQRRYLFPWLLSAGLLCAQSAPPAQSTGELRAEAEQAQGLVEQQNFVAALPLYENLHTAQPENPLYQERLALCLLGVSKQQEPAQAVKTRDRARGLLVAAQAAGDHSNMLQILLESLGRSEPTAAPAQPGQEMVDEGEKAFTRGDLAGALEAYKRALAINPRLYTAALFAGDVEFKQNHFAEAGDWFSKAIAIDPDTETAYRYWGDALEKAGNHQHAEDEFIAAIVAQPYMRAPRIGLQQWATRNHAQVLAPPIQLPAAAAVTAGKGGKGVNITLPPAGGTDAKAADNPATFAYTLNAALWRSDKFAKTFPRESAYRHSLAEAVDSIHIMLAVAQEQHIPEKDLSSTLKLLREIDGKGMLECWILLDNADAGIARDYAAFRSGHRPVLARYIAAYDVHPQ